MHDALFIGSGHNNLAAAVLLAEAGWKVAVLEQADEPGGAVRTAELTLPGFRHDLLANTHIHVRISPFYRRFQAKLGEHGLDYLRSPVVGASLFPDGDTVAVHRDLDLTAESLGRQSAADAAGWRKLYALYEETKEAFITLFTTPLPSSGTVLAVLKSRRRFGARGNLDFAQMLVLPVRTFAENYLESDKAKAWLVAPALHPTYGPESAGGGAFAWLYLAIGQDPEGGLALPRGGSGGLTLAMTSLLRSLGGEVHTGARVTEVVVRRGTAQGVRLEDGTELRAGRAVIAGTAPTKLFLDLVGEEHLPAEFTAKLPHYRYGPPLVKLDYALSEAPAWIGDGTARKATVLNLSPGVDAMSLAHNQTLRGYLPEEPLLIVSSTTLIDPSRAPEGKHILWVLARFPYEVKGDAAGQIAPRPWEHLKERVADRMESLLEKYAPGFKKTVLARNVFSPEDQERIDPNLVHGDSGTGSVELHQSYVFRPLPGWSRYATPVRRLYLCGAATQPGPGINTMSGSALASLLSR